MGNRAGQLFFPVRSILLIPCSAHSWAGDGLEGRHRTWSTPAGGGVRTAGAPRGPPRPPLPGGPDEGRGFALEGTPLLRDWRPEGNRAARRADPPCPTRASRPAPARRVHSRPSTRPAQVTGVIQTSPKRSLLSRRDERGSNRSNPPGTRAWRGQNGLHPAPDHDRQGVSAGSATRVRACTVYSLVLITQIPISAGRELTRPTLRWRREPSVLNLPPVVSDTREMVNAHDDVLAAWRRDQRLREEAL